MATLTWGEIARTVLTPTSKNAEGKQKQTGGKRGGQVGVREGRGGEAGGGRG